MSRTPEINHVPPADVEPFLPKFGSEEFRQWRASGLRIDHWIAKTYPESALARRVAPPDAELAQATFGLHEPREAASDAWAEGRE